MTSLHGMTKGVLKPPEPPPLATPLEGEEDATRTDFGDGGWSLNLAM